MTSNSVVLVTDTQYFFTAYPYLNAVSPKRLLGNVFYVFTLFVGDCRILRLKFIIKLVLKESKLSCEKKLEKKNNNQCGTFCYRQREERSK